MIHRNAVRAVLLAPGGRMLLMQLREPSAGREIWLAPGGGLHPGEGPEACLRREVREETGLQVAEVGPLVWRRRHRFTWNGRRMEQHERFHLVPVVLFEPSIAANPEEAERHAFRRFRWWAADEIARSQDLFAPRRLAEHLRALIEHGAPPAPIDVGA